MDVMKIASAGNDFVPNTQYLKVRYSRTTSARHVNKSGNMANGPRPNRIETKSSVQ